MTAIFFYFYLSIKKRFFVMSISFIELKAIDYTVFCFVFCDCNKVINCNIFILTGGGHSGGGDGAVSTAT